MTLFFVCDPGSKKILLGMKKKGFGQGRWNGFGGRVESGETPAQAAERELMEESSLTAINPEKCGIISFTFEGEPDVLEVHTYWADKFSGQPTESDEMVPKWFDYSEIPYEQMWPDDKFWLPLVLSGKKIVAGFQFKDQNTILRHNIIEVEKLE